MVETKKEKRLRYLLILIFVGITVSALFYKYNGESEINKDNIPIAIVAHKSTGDNDNPVVVMYHYQDGQHILAQYEIDRNANFRFKTLDAVKLKQSPSELILDQEKGFWIKVSDKWEYFDRTLQQQERSTKFIGDSTHISFTIEEDKKEKWLVLEDKRRVKIDSIENVIQVHSLSNKKDLLLLITDLGAKISTFDTK